VIHEKIGQVYIAIADGAPVSYT